MSDSFSQIELNNNLFEACDNPKENILQVITNLIDQCSDVNGIINIKKIISDYQAYLNNKLFEACDNPKENILEVITNLLDRGADVNATHKYKYTLAYALLEKDCSKEIIELLIDRGFDINQNNGEYGSILHKACEKRNREVIQLLIDKGADVNNIDIMTLR